MSQPNTYDSFRLAFLTAIELPDRGHVGGLLVTNHLGRPLEFQCTAPVKANRTQEILYGPTLVPYVLCDLIGRTLLEKVSVKPQLVLVDDPRLLAVREEVSVPVAVCTTAGETAAASATQLRLFSAPQAARDGGGSQQRPDGSAPGAQGSGVNTQYTVASTPYPVLSTQYSVPGTQCAESATGDPGVGRQDHIVGPQVPVGDTVQATPGADDVDGRARENQTPLARADAAPRRGAAIVYLGRRRITLHPAFAADALVLDEARRRLSGDADLGEPFERVREALRETLGAAA